MTGVHGEAMIVVCVLNYTRKTRVVLAGNRWVFTQGMQAVGGHVGPLIESIMSSALSKCRLLLRQLTDMLVDYWSFVSSQHLLAGWPNEYCVCLLC